MYITYMYGVWGLDIQKFVYIGKSNKPLVRFKVHMKRSASLCFRKLVEEKGVDSFELIMLERTIFFELRSWVKREKFWIKKFRAEGHPLCNKNSGGGGITEHTEEVIARISLALTGRDFSEEHRANLSKANSGENNPMYGKHQSQEARVKTSNALLGEKCPLYGKTGEDHPRYGTQHTKETLIKMGEAHAKPYPAFFNTQTGEYIPAGENLWELCKRKDFKYSRMWDVKATNTKQTRDGWKLATEEEQP